MWVPWTIWCSLELQHRRPKQSRLEDNNTEIRGITLEPRGNQKQTGGTCCRYERKGHGINRQLVWPHRVQMALRNSEVTCTRWLLFYYLRHIC
jgi:hypothetical protein